MTVVDIRATDPARIDGLAGALAEIGPALERFATDRPEGLVRPYLAEVPPLPQHGAGLDAVLDELAEVVIPHGNRVGAPGFCGWVKSQPTTVGAAAVVAAAVAGAQDLPTPSTASRTSPCAGSRSSRAAARVAGRARVGGSTANLVGLGAARQAAYEAIGVDASGAGLAGAPPGRVYGSDETHHVVHRACGVLGLGRRGVVALPARRDGTLDPDDLDRVLTADRRAGLVPVAVVASAGTVNQGAIDPFAALADVAEAHETWLHVDGAYGLFGVLDPRISDRYAGLERASSAAVDPHKWLAVPVGVGRGVRARPASSSRGHSPRVHADYLEGSFGSAAEAPESQFDAIGAALGGPGRGADLTVAGRGRVGHAARAGRRRCAGDACAVTSAWPERWPIGSAPRTPSSSCCASRTCRSSATATSCPTGRTGTTGRRWTSATPGSSRCSGRRPQRCRPAPSSMAGTRSSALLHQPPHHHRRGRGARRQHRPDRPLVGF